MKLRRYEPGDGEVLRRIFLAAVMQTAPRFYDERQVMAWASRARTPEQYDLKASDGRILLIATVDDRPVAYGDVEPNGHIDHLFCDPSVGGRGFGTAIYEALEVSAREQGVARLHVEASEGARPLFLRKGFDVIARNDLEIGGVAIHNYRMEKRLAEVS